MAEAKLTKFDDYMCFLDFMLSTGRKGNLPDDVIIANILRALPENIGEKVLYTDDNLTIKKLYSFLSNLKIKKEEDLEKFCNQVVKKDNKNDRFCIFCSTKGHTANYCFKLKKRFKEKKQKVNLINEVSEENESKENKKFYYLFTMGSNLPIVKCLFNNNKMLNVLFDTGCYWNLINSKHVSNLKLDKISIQLKGANSLPISVKGKLKNFSVVVNDTTYKVDFIVVENICVDMILGFKFLCENKLSIDCTSNFKLKNTVRDNITKPKGVDKIQVDFDKLICSTNLNCTNEHKLTLSSTMGGKNNSNDKDKLQKSMTDNDKKNIVGIVNEEKYEIEHCIALILVTQNRFLHHNIG